MAFDIGAPIQFTDTTVLDASILPQFSWDFGDGNTSTKQNPVHSYAAAGTYSVVFTITDQHGRSDSATVAVTILPAAPVADFSFQPDPAVAGQPVQFTDHSTGAGLTYLWDFGGGNTSGVTDPIYTFADPGEYPVTLNITDSEGRTDSITTTVTVLAA